MPVRAAGSSTRCRPRRPDAGGRAVPAPAGGVPEPAQLLRVHQLVTSGARRAAGPRAPRRARSPDPARPARRPTRRRPPFLSESAADIVRQAARTPRHVGVAVRRVRQRDGEVEVRGEGDRALAHVAHHDRDAGGLGDGVDLERVQDAAGLHELDHEHVAGARLDAGERLARAAHALVERDGHVDALAHEARRLEVVHAHRLLDELEAVRLEELDGAHRRPARPTSPGWRRR